MAVVCRYYNKFEQDEQFGLMVNYKTLDMLLSDVPAFQLLNFSSISMHNGTTQCKLYFSCSVKKKKKCCGVNNVT